MGVGNANCLEVGHIGNFIFCPVVYSSKLQYMSVASVDKNYYRPYLQDESENQKSSDIVHHPLHVYTCKMKP